jgi:hypothetical protein
MKILAEPLFLQFFVPLITVSLTVLVKVVSRNDRYTRFKKEDLAVGLDVAVIALILFIGDSAGLARTALTQSSDLLRISLARLASVPWILLAFVLGLWGVSTLIRWLGWKAQDEMNTLWGVIAPDIFGLLALFFVVNWIG